MSIRGRFIAVVATAVLAALPAGEASAQSFAEPTLRDLVTRADRVVVSQVVEVRAERRQTRDGEMPVTLVVLAVEKTLKGAPSVQRLLEFAGGEVPGASGDAAADRLEIVGMPAFQVGDRDVLFLSAAGSLSPVVGLERGRYRVRADGAGNVILTAADGKATLGPDGRPISLKALEALVARMVSGGTKTADGEAISLTTADPADRAMPATVSSPWPAPRGKSVGEAPSPGEGRGAAAAGSRWPAPLAVSIGLGASPALLNGCPDWTCVVARTLEPFGAAPSLGGTRAAGSDKGAEPRSALAGKDDGRTSARTIEDGKDHGRTSAPAVENVKDLGRTSAPPVEQGHVELQIMWATDVFGRTLDDLTPAVTMRRETDGRRTVSVLLNRSLAWNAYEGAPRTDAGGRPLLDMERILAAELRRVFELAPAASAVAADSAGTAPERNPVAPARSASSAALASGGRRVAGSEEAGVQASARRRVPGAEETSVQVRALAPCDPNSGVMTNPRMLVFQSPDDWAMSGYQVGFFREGVSSPERTVDLGRDAFLIRRVADLPSGIAATMQPSFAVMINTAGLSTPTGIVYTYRVRGVWSGGTTAWSAPSQPFANCPES